MTGKRITLANYKEIKSYIIEGFEPNFVQMNFNISAVTHYRIKRSKSYADYKRMVNPAKRKLVKAVKVQKAVSVKTPTKLDLMKEHKLTQAKLNYLIDLIEKPRDRPETAPIKSPKLFESWFK